MSVQFAVTTAKAHSSFAELDKSYWDQLWSDSPLPSAFDPKQSSLASHVDGIKHLFFTEVVQRMTPRPARFVEVGCASSRWLPYFANQFGLEVWGLDYSELGCKRAGQILAAAGVSGRIVYANLFNPPPEMLRLFDLVASFGVIEHFENTAECIRACSDLLKPGGTIITIIPNLRGLPGALQRRIDRRIFDGHVALDCEQLTQAHCDAGLIVRESTYLLFINLCVLNFEGYRSRTIRRLGTGSCQLISRFFWFLERANIPLRPNRNTSPLIACVAQKPPTSSNRR